MRDQLVFHTIYTALLANFPFKVTQKRIKAIGLVCSFTLGNFNVNFETAVVDHF